MDGRQYLGKAGQLAIMAELAVRGYNVAIPEMDIGDDIFTVNDASGQLRRIQVKTGTGVPLKKNHAFRSAFRLRKSHLNNAAIDGVFYAFVIRCNGFWRYIVIDRSVLKHLIHQGLGTDNGDYHLINLIFFKDGLVRSSTRDNAINLDNFYKNWDSWPKLI